MSNILSSFWREKIRSSVYMYTENNNLQFFCTSSVKGGAYHCIGEHPAHAPVAVATKVFEQSLSWKIKIIKSQKYY